MHVFSALVTLFGLFSFSYALALTRRCESGTELHFRGKLSEKVEKPGAPGEYTYNENRLPMLVFMNEMTIGGNKFCDPGFDAGVSAIQPAAKSWDEKNRNTM